jgi:predicted metalloendopeptidase
LIIGDNKDLAKQFFETVPHGLAMAVYSRATVQNYHDYALDNHPLGASRINAPFSSFDIFYEVYDIKEGDPMYTASENRLHLW